MNTESLENKSQSKRTDEDILKYPSLRNDLKVSRQVLSERVMYVVKDPLKNQFYRFDESEWSIISLFDGQTVIEEMADKFQKKNRGKQLTLENIKDYKESLTNIHLLEKSKRDQNVMLIEKMKESRQSQLLSKKGSLMYKRFPLVDPDKAFNKIIPYIGFFWTKAFFIFSLLCMCFGAYLITARWPEFKSGAFEVFSFGKMGLINLAVLWVTIYVTIAIHELGHGLTCKYYGGEVHEIGVLVMFFQPCLYANVNDAWLFDKKWKQILVTLAGGFIEVWIGSIFAMIWAFTNPNTFINVLSMQVVTICTAATVLFNFNPLMKLDGYYLLADFLEMPNLRENAFKYIKYLTSRYIFQNKSDEFESTKRERKYFTIYGIAAFFWVASSMLGLFMMARGMLIDYFHEFGILLSFLIAYKLFGGQAKQGLMFVGKWYIGKRQKLQELFQQKNFQIRAAISLVIALIALFIPTSFSVYGKCVLEPSFMRVLRAESDGQIIEFIKHDGDIVSPDSVVAKMDNYTLQYDRSIAALAVEKQEKKLRETLVNDISKLEGLKQELDFKMEELKKKDEMYKNLTVTYHLESASDADTFKNRQIASQSQVDSGILSCKDEIRKLGSFVKKGDEICRVLGANTLRAVVEVTETQVRFIKESDKVEFKLNASPFKTYEGVVNKIRVLSTPNQFNPKEKLYSAEIEIRNPIGELKSGLSGDAKIIAQKVSLLTNIGRKLTAFLRLDLFF